MNDAAVRVLKKNVVLQVKVAAVRILKKNVVLHVKVAAVNDAAVRIRLVIFVPKVQLFFTQITEQTGGGRVEMRGEPPL